jgi:aldose 1-epimerase
MLTTEPSVQIYTGNYFDGSKAGKTGHLYRMGDGIALEPGLPPDTPHHPEFGDARVDPGKPYRHIMVYRVGWRAGGMLRKN